MKPFDENDLIAYHLDELPKHRRKDLERALEADAELLGQSESIAETLRGFKGHSPFDLNPGLQDGLVEWNWKVLSPALPRYPAAKPPFARRYLPVLAGAGLAFAAVTVTFLKWHHLPAGKQGASQRLPVKTPMLAPSQPDASAVIHEPLRNTATEDGIVQQQRTVGLRHAPGTSSGAAHQPFAVTTPAPSSQPAQVTASAVASPNLSATPFTASVTPATPTPPIPGVLPSVTVEPGSGSPAQIVAEGRTIKGEHVAVHHDHTTEMTLAMGGTLIPTHYNDVSGKPTSSGATHAVIAIASFHQQFRPAAGYRVTLSYSRPEFFYGYGTFGYVNGRMYEAAGTYVVQGPSRGRLSTSVEAGAGFMHLTPTIKDPTTGNNTRVAGILGVGADLMLSKRIGIHAAYRGQVFNGPDFQYSGIGAPINTKILVSNEPSLGITYRFSHR